jgi:hypothetical protein
VYVHPWPLRLLFVQLAAIYFFNGIYKLAGTGWLSGEVMHYVLGNVQWTRWSAPVLWLPTWAVRLLTWFTLAWEIGFPLLVMVPTTRAATLWIGALFHVGTGLLLRIGVFPLYMLCLYLPLLPWDEWADRWRRAAPAAGDPAGQPQSPVSSRTRGPAS